MAKGLVLLVTCPSMEDQWGISEFVRARLSESDR